MTEQKKSHPPYNRVKGQLYYYPEGGAPILCCGYKMKPFRACVLNPGHTGDHSWNRTPDIKLEDIGAAF